jgi:hypothetical protein
MSLHHCLLLLPWLLASRAEAQLFSGSSLTSPASDVLSGRFLTSLNTTQVALIISIAGLVILAIAGGLFLLSFFRPSASSSNGYGGDYSSATNTHSSYSYPGYRRLR